MVNRDIPPPRAIPQSQAGKTYQRLSKQLNGLRATRQDWERTLETCQSRAQQELLPLHERYATQALALLQLADQRLQDKSLRWGKLQQQKAWEALLYLGMHLQDFPLPEADCARWQDLLQGVPSENGI